MREAARNCAARVFPRTGADVLGEALLFLLERMHEWQRWQEDGAGNRAIRDDLMTRPEVCERLVERLSTARGGRMEHLLRRACRWPGLDPFLPDLARRAFLPSLRAYALRFLIEERATWPEGYRREWVDKSYGLARRVRVIGERRFVRSSDVETLVVQGAQDRSAIVRRVAGDALVRHRSGLDDAMLALVRQLADDKSPSVRERATFILKERAAR